jgi:hypothetical protein
MIESLGEPGVGRILTSVAVGCGRCGIVAGVTDPAGAEQAVSINSSIKLLNRTSGKFFIQETKIL